MKCILQKLILFLLLFSAHTLRLSAQKNRFIYIQTENKQPFYVKIENRLFSSSATGYLIIPKLTEGTYSLSIGFPKNEWPAQNVRCVIKDADAGYLLKNFTGRGWGLLNLQTLHIEMAEKETENKSVSTTENAEDTFSNVLASVVNDPGILKKQKISQDTLLVSVNQQNKQDENLAVKKNDTPVFTDKGNTDSIIDKPGILKLKSDNTPDGMNISFLDIIQGSADTVTIFIPKQESTISKITEEQPKKHVREQQKEKIKEKDSKFIDMELPNPNLKEGNEKNVKDTIAIAEKKAAITQLKNEPDSNTDNTALKQVSENAGCKKIAVNNDFLNLRKLMASETSDSGMIKTALTFFKLTCFSTEQIKNLGVLFLKEEGKYRFYVAAYPYVSDSSVYGSLEKQLSDDYYISRFKVMLHH